MLALICAAAISSAHNVSHGVQLAASDGAVTTMADHHGPAPDRHDGGHNHLQGFSFPVIALFGGADLRPPPPPAAAPPASQVATLAFRAADPPLPDPPRTA